MLRREEAAVSVAESAAMDYLADLGEAAGEDHQILRRPSEAARRENEGVQVPESDTSQTRRLSTLLFQAEGHRHCVVLIINFGNSRIGPTHGGGWRSDIAVALEATCCSIHAWFDCKFDTDPRVLRCIGWTDSVEHPITEDAFTSRRKMVKEDAFWGTLVASSRGPFESQSRGGWHNHHEATPAVSAAHPADPYLCLYQSKQNAQSEILINMITNSVASPACDGHASAAQPGSAGGASSSPAALLRLHHMKVGITMHGG